MIKFMANFIGESISCECRDVWPLRIISQWEYLSSRRSMGNSISSLGIERSLLCQKQEKREDNCAI